MPKVRVCVCMLDKSPVLPVLRLLVRNQLAMHHTYRGHSEQQLIISTFSSLLRHLPLNGSRLEDDKAPAYEL